MLSIFCLPVQADDWKFERGIDIVVSFGAGSGNDQTARTLAPILKNILGVNVTVTNIAGGSGLVGMEYAAAQPADGYTFFMHTPTHIVFSLQKMSSLNLLEDFVPVSKLVEEVFLVDGSAKGKYKNWQELYEFASKNPGALSLGGTGGVGVDFIAASLLMQATGIDFRYVSFDGGAELKSALLGGHLDYGLEKPSTVRELVKAGTLNTYIVLANDRLSIFPDTPCTKELGYDVTFGPLRAICAKKGTPQGAIDALEAAIAEAVKTPEWQQYLDMNELHYKEGYADAEGLRRTWNLLAETLPEILASIQK